MSEYRKKPVVIEAVKWTGDNLREIIDFTGLHPSANKWTWDEYAAVVREDGLKIFTLEGSHMATVGDMIIKGVQGEFYPCKPDIFAATYEATELAGQDAERLDWLSVPGRGVEGWEEDKVKSRHEPRKAVHHYIKGRYTITQGDTLRAAIDAALAATLATTKENKG